MRICIPKTKRTGTEYENYYAADVKEKYQVTPTEFIDVKALQGDASDNIPGVPGIGEKTAQALIAQYGSIEAVHEKASEIKPPRAGKNIVEFWEQARMSKVLAKIDTQVPIDYRFEDAMLRDARELYTEEAYLLCKRLEFKNLLGRFDVQAPGSAAQESFLLIETRKEADRFFDRQNGNSFAFFVIPDMLGLSVSFGEDATAFLPVGEDVTGTYLCGKLSGAIASLREGQTVRVMDLPGQTPQGDWDAYEKARASYLDIGVAAYLINPLTGSYPYDDIAKDYLGQLVPSREDLLGKSKPDKVLEENREKVMTWACLESYVAYAAAQPLLEKLQEKEMLKLYREMEMPVLFVLADMEHEGIRMDADALAEYGRELSRSIKELETKIYALAGEEFNINSPKQLGTILFEKLSLPHGKKTKTGYSTSAEVLEKLAPEYPLVASILEYRQLAKLKSTYADGLLAFVREDGKIHTTFHQTITATGRLSSTDPNLQNIPIRIELGKRIRKVFYPQAGNLFIDSDYSQIELRVLAHMANDGNLIEAFRQKKDIHTTTASQVFHVAPGEVTPLMRRNAKAVNFGIVYGISAFGLSQDLNISRGEAQDYIDRYYETYPKIKEFLERAVGEAKENGAIRTMFGRIRPIPELSSSNFMQRQFGERVAMNSPIQGTAADIIKIAMIRVHDRLYREGYAARLILQVHDELLIEAPEAEKEKIVTILEEEMKGAADLSIEMDVETEIGYNWFDAH